MTPPPHPRQGIRREAGAGFGVRLRLREDRRDGRCSATTLQDRRNEWIDLGMMDALREMALEAYDRFVGLELPAVAVDCCVTKATNSSEEIPTFKVRSIKCPLRFQPKGNK